jgi:protein Mpv17
VDQLLWCPLFTAALFCFTGITAGFSPREIFAIFKISGPQVILSSWLIWPAAHAVNFRVIPGRQRLLYINVIQLFFNSILSALANNVV